MKFTVPVILILGGAILAIVSALTIVAIHPVVVLLIGAGVGLFLLGKKLKK